MGRTSEPGIAGDGADHRLRIFISYRRQETAPYAGRLYDELAERFGESQVFMDVDTIQAGADFEQEIVATIARANVVLAVVGPRWLTVSDHDGRRRLDDPDDFVRRELDAALQGDARVIPLLVQDAEMPATEDLPEPLRAFGRRQALILSDRRWRADVGELIGVLDDLAAGTARQARRDGSTARPRAPTGATARRPVPLPHHRTSFVGRDDDVERIDQLLATSGFVTIVGPGGVGKSRLAVEVARRVEDRYDDGVGLVDLAAIDDPSLIVPAIMRATAAGTGERDSSLDALVAQLADRCLLLLLDNCEHVIGDAAIVAEGLALRCPALHVLATSREALLVDCEAVWPLDPLATPDVDVTTGSGALAESAAVRLFVDRAVLSSPRFTLDDATAPTVARLVAALDGLPLAIELAASSLRSVPLEAVMTGLSDQFASVAARRTSHTRQRTLWATVDWSYQLLDAAEQLLLERVGVFASSFTAAVAATVCGAGLPDGSVGPTMLRLVDRSLVSVVDDDGTGTRYRLLYSVRDFARSRLATRADDPTPGRLQAWAVDVATTHGRIVDVGDELVGLRLLDAEHPNLIAALGLALGSADGDVAGRITSALAPYWEVRGLRAEGLAWVLQALALVPADDDVLLAASNLAAERLAATGEFDLRRARAETALAAATRAGSDRLAGAALAELGHIDFETDHRDAARRHLATALERARAADDEAGVAVALLRLALCRQGDRDARSVDESERLLGEATELYRRLGNRRGQLWCLAELGFARLESGAVAPAADCFERGLAFAVELGYLHGEAWLRDALGETAAALGNAADAAAQFEAACTIQLRLGDELNRGWSLGGLVRAAVRTGELAEALHWLDEFAAFLVGDMVALYEYACLLRAGSVAILADRAELAGLVLGALDALEAPPSLSPMDAEDQRSLEAAAAAALGDVALAEARGRGRGVPARELVRQLSDSCAPATARGVGQVGAGVAGAVGDVATT